MRWFLIGLCVPVLLSCSAAAPKDTGARDGLDREARSACKGLSEFVDDAAKGVLTLGEQRAEAKAIVQHADRSDSYAVRSAATSLLAALTTGTDSQADDAMWNLAIACGQVSGRPSVEP